MDLTSVPTDNLYKFMAISGLLLIFFCCSVPVWYAKDSHGIITNLKKEAEILQLEMQYLDMEIKEEVGNKPLKDLVISDLKAPTREQFREWNIKERELVGKLEEEK